MAMIIMDALRWWYGPGWRWFAYNFFIAKNEQLARFFSFKDLSKTLFSPFRQDSSGAKNAPLNIKLQAMGMNLVSRFFGFGIRSFLLIAGIISIIVSSIFGLVASVAWPFIPFTPAIGLLFLSLGIGSS